MKIFLSIFISIIFQSCFIYNSTRKQETICDLHNEKMKKTIVRTWYGTPASWGDENEIKYRNAKKKKHMGCVKNKNLGIKRYALIYYCITCDNIKKEFFYKKSNLTQKESTNGRP